ncbi:hypothetical protein [uncultured Parasphingorhabdus sp.]|uniref:hypothetical protein n=1 Tax=uncultured Parasphingorhabdus sp. TaxID=2709694 RepID=UPI0030D9659C
MAVRETTLEGLTSAEFKKAERLFKRAFYSQLIIAAFGMLTIFITNGNWSLIFAVAAMIGYMIWFLISLYHRESRGQAERGRRAMLISDGLSEHLSPSEARDIEVAFTVTKEDGKFSENPDFFATDKAAGNDRLAEMLEESAFYSCNLYAASARQTWVSLFLFMCIAIAMFASSMLFLDVSQIQLGARLLCATLVLLMSQDIAGNAMAYASAHRQLAGFQSRLKNLRLSGYPQPDLLLLLGDYNSAVESAPMMAPGVYQQNRVRLDELWRKHAEA